MAIEYRIQAKHYDFFINEKITESLYQKIKKEVEEKIKEIEEIRQNNKMLGIPTPDKEKIDFNFYLSTYGGIVYDGLGVYDLLKGLDNREDLNVTIYAQGKVMSMGIPIILSVKNRYTSPNTTFMIHQISTMTWGKLEDIKEDVTETERLEKIVENIIISNTKITQDQLNEWKRHRLNVYFDATKAVEFGIVKDIKI